MLFEKIKNEKGQAIVEFALVVPIAFMIFGAILDFGWLFTHELVLSTAVRDGARLGITCADDANFNTKVRNCVLNEAGICDESRLQITPSRSGDDVIVSVVYDLEMLTPVSEMIFSGMTYRINTSCTMKAE